MHTVFTQLNDFNEFLSPGGVQVVMAWKQFTVGELPRDKEVSRSILLITFSINENMAKTCLTLASNKISKIFWWLIGSSYDWLIIIQFKIVTWI